MRNLSYLLAIVLAIGAVVWLVSSNRSSPPASIAPPTNQFSTPEFEEPPEPTTVESVVARSVEEETVNIRGFVQSVDTGEGIEGATVKISRKEEDELRVMEKTTDAEGGFVVSAPVAGDYSLEVSHPVLVSEEKQYTITVREDERPSDLVIWMAPGSVISGRVYDSITNEGIAGVKVGLNGVQVPSDMTDPDGRYRLEGIRAGSGRIFLAHAKGYIDPPSHSDGVRVTVSLEHELVDVDFPLQPGVFAAIEGKVVDLRGNPVRGAEVSARSHNRLTKDVQGNSDKTEADGTFRFEEFRVAGGFYVTAKSAGHVSEELGPLGLTADGIRDLVLTLRATGSISGQVVDENTGEPVAEPAIMVDTKYTSEGRNIVGGRSDNLDGEGNFKIADLPPGKYGLFLDPSPIFQSRGRARLLATVDLEYGQHLTGIQLTFDYQRQLQRRAARNALDEEQAFAESIPIPRKVEVSGRVVQARTGDPVTTFSMRIGYSTSLRTVHDPDGRFTFEKNEEVTTRLIIAAKGYATKEEVVQSSVGEQRAHDITVRLQPGALVDGIVLDASRNAVAGATIHIGIDPTTFRSDPMGAPADTVSGPDGSFRLDTLSAAKTRIYASHPSFTVGSAEVSASSARATRLEILMGKGGSIAGIVRRSGVPISEQVISVINDAGTNLKLTGSRTDSEGQFRMDHVAPGSYRLYTLIDDRSRWLFIDAVVADGKVTEANFDFTDTGNVVEGAVLLDGQPPSYSYAWAEIQTAGRLERFRSTNLGSGVFALTDLPVGDVLITVWASQGDEKKVRESFTLSITGGVMQRNFDLHSEQ